MEIFLNFTIEMVKFSGKPEILNLNYFYFMEALCCLLSGSPRSEDGYVESLWTTLCTVSVRDLTSISNAEKKSLKYAVALFSQVYSLPGLFGPSHLFIELYFKAIYFCRTQLALSKYIVYCRGERRHQNVSLSLREVLK